MKNYMEYKGYHGSVKYSKPDDILYGTILGIDDLVSYEGTSVQEIENDFKTAVEDYLIFCEENDKRPNVPKYENEPCACVVKQ